MRKIFKISLLFLVLLVWISCEAPHENPLDPYNSESKLVTLKGKVRTESYPVSPIADALLIWKNTGESVFSNASGEFEFELRKKNNGYLICKKNNFYPDSVYITWASENSISKNFFLNQIPSVVSFKIKSFVFFSDDSTASQTIAVETIINDKDNDIDSVFLINKYFNFKTALTYNPAQHLWQKNISNYDFGITSFEEIIGKNFSLFIKEKNHHSIEIQCGSLTRTITIPPRTISPRSDDIIDLPYLFSWQPYPAGFDFTYQIRLFRNEIPSQLSFEVEDIPKDSTSYYLDASLQQGNYYWMLYVVDEFGNLVRSQPVNFKIEN